MSNPKLHYSEPLVVEMRDTAADCETRQLFKLCEDWLTLHAALAALRAERDDLIARLQKRREELGRLRDLYIQTKAERDAATEQQLANYEGADSHTCHPTGTLDSSGGGLCEHCGRTLHEQPGYSDALSVADAQLAQAQAERDGFERRMNLHGANAVQCEKERDAAEARAAELAGALEKVEWCVDAEGGIEKCHWCGEERWIGAVSGKHVGGHAEDCPRQLALAAARLEAMRTEPSEEYFSLQERINALAQALYVAGLRSIEGGLPMLVAEGVYANLYRVQRVGLCRVKGGELPAALSAPPKEGT